MWGTTELELDGNAAVELELSEPHELDFDEDEYIQVIERPAERFGGPYEVTPTATAQTLSTDGLVMTADVVIQPIPSNWGRVAWNGAVLTVS